jgi:hypothetical protein
LLAVFYVAFGRTGTIARRDCFIVLSKQDTVNFLGVFFVQDFAATASEVYDIARRGHEAVGFPKRGTHGVIKKRQPKEDPQL